MQGDSGQERSTWNVELRQRRGTHGDTRQCTRESTIDDDINKAVGHTCFTLDDPVKRRLLKKTNLLSSDVLMAVEIKDTDLLHTVSTLLNDEVQRMTILSALDDYEEG